MESKDQKGDPTRAKTKRDDIIVLCEQKKVTCSVCRKKRDWEDTVKVSRKRAGSYNRGGSSTSTTVCYYCTAEQVQHIRNQQFREGRYWPVPLNDEIYWTQAADHFGFAWDDLPKNSYTPAKVRPEGAQ